MSYEKEKRKTSYRIQPVRFVRVRPISSCRTSSLNIEWHCGINLLNGKIGALMLEGDRASLWGRSRRGTAEISASVRALSPKSCSAKRLVERLKKGVTATPSEVPHSALKISEVISHVEEAEYLAGCRDKESVRGYHQEGILTAQKNRIHWIATIVYVSLTISARSKHIDSPRQWTPLLPWSYVGKISET